MSGQFRFVADLNQLIIELTNLQIRDHHRSIVKNDRNFCLF